MSWWIESQEVRQRREWEQPHHFSSRSLPLKGTGGCGELLFYFHFYNAGLSDFLGWSNLPERVICFISFHNLALRRPKNKNMSPLTWLLGEFVWHMVSQIYISDLCYQIPYSQGNRWRIREVELLTKNEQLLGNQTLINVYSGRIPF